MAKPGVHIGFLVVAISVGGAVGCDLEHDVGETASSTTGMASGSESGSNSESGVLDTGAVDTSTTGDDTGVVDTGPWDSSTGGEGSTGGEPTSCEATEGAADLSSMTWPPIGNRAVYRGPCTVTAIDPVDQRMVAQLDCTFDGTVDGAPIQDQAFALELGFAAAGAQPLSVDQEVDAHFAINQWFGVSQWLVLTEAGDASALVVEAISAIALDPATENSALGSDIDALYGMSGWPRFVDYSAGASQCALAGASCGAEALLVTASADAADIQLNPGQGATLSSSATPSTSRGPRSVRTTPDSGFPSPRLEPRDPIE
jgi:hypothetical protein